MVSLLISVAVTSRTKCVCSPRGLHLPGRSAQACALCETSARVVVGLEAVKLRVGWSFYWPFGYLAVAGVNDSPAVADNAEIFRDNEVRDCHKVA